MGLLERHSKFFKWFATLLVGIPGIAEIWAALLIDEPLIPYIIKKAGGLDMSNNIWLIALPFVLMALGAFLLFLIWIEGKKTKEHPIKRRETETENLKVEKKPRIYKSMLMLNDQYTHKCSQCGFGVVVDKYAMGVVCPKCGNADDIMLRM